MKKIIKRKYARFCEITGEGMNEGYFLDDDMPIKYEKDLIKELRSRGDKEYNNASDEFILNEAYECGDYFWTTWECWKCWYCEAENTHYLDDFGFCKECLQSQ